MRLTIKLLLALAFTVPAQCIYAQWSLTGDAGTDPTVNFLGTTDFTDFKIKTDDKLRLVVRRNGNVGIGIGAPKSKLHVQGTITGKKIKTQTIFDNGSSVCIGTTGAANGYMFCVAGKAIFEEVRVELEGSWPDYVFEPGHPLMSLGELKAYLAEYRHLPGMPSAREVKSRGHHLGAIQTRLVEKTEENTLYILQLKEEIEELKARLDALQHTRGQASQK